MGLTKSQQDAFIRMGEQFGAVVGTMGVSAREAGYAMARMAQNIQAVSTGALQHSPRFKHPDAARWALLWAEDNPEHAATEKQIQVGQLCRLGGWPEGTVVFLTRDMERSGDVARKGMVGIVMDGTDPALPHIAFTTVSGAFGDPWFTRWMRVPTTPDCPLAVLREVTGEIIP